MGLVWYGAAQEQGSSLSSSSIVSYYIISTMVFGLSNFHASYIENDIAEGYVSKFLTRPFSAFWAYFAQESGTAWLELSIKALAMLPILWYIGFSFPSTWQVYALLAVYLPLIFLFSFSFYAIFSFMAFWFTEIYAVRWGIAAGMRFMAGFFVPITLMPLWFRTGTFFLPFQHLGTTPILLFQNEVSLTYGLQALAILGGWTALAYLAQAVIWKTAVRVFDGVGI